MPLSISQYIAELQRIQKEQTPRVAQALLRSAEDGARLARKRTYERKVVDTGEFAEGWHAEKRGDGAAIVNNADDAAFADGGREPGKAPPLDAIRAWAKRRGLPESAVFPISRKIAQEGTEGAKVNDWVAEQVRPIIERNVTEELEK